MRDKSGAIILMVMVILTIVVVYFSVTAPVHADQLVSTDIIGPSSRALGQTDSGQQLGYFATSTGRVVHTYSMEESPIVSNQTTVIVSVYTSSSYSVLIGTYSVTVTMLRDGTKQLGTATFGTLPAGYYDVSVQATGGSGGGQDYALYGSCSIPHTSANYYNTVCDGTPYFDGFPVPLPPPPQITSITPVDGSTVSVPITTSVTYDNPAGSGYTEVTYRIYDQNLVLEPSLDQVYQPLVFLATTTASYGTGITWTPTTTLSLATSTYTVQVTLVPASYVQYSISSSTIFAAQWTPPVYWPTATTSIGIPFSSLGSTTVGDATTTAVWSPTLKYFDLYNLLLTRFPFSWMIGITIDLFRIARAVYVPTAFTPFQVTVPAMGSAASSSLTIFSTSTIAVYFTDSTRQQYRDIFSFVLWLSAIMYWYQEIRKFVVTIGNAISR